MNVLTRYKARKFSRHEDSAQRQTGGDRPRSLDLRQRLLDVGDDVVLVLDADRETHDVRPGARRGALLVGELAVRGRGRMDDERARVADVGQVAKQAQRADEGDARLVAAL